MTVHILDSSSLHSHNSSASELECAEGNYVGGIAAATAVCVPASYYLYGRYMRAKMNRKIEARGQRTRDNLDAMREDLAKHAAIVDDSIVQLSFRELQKGLQDGEITATAALRSYQARALEVNDEINAVTDVLEDAKGLDCTAGFGELIDVPWKEDGVLVQVLKSKGAVPFIRTNLPQGMRSFACANPIYGETCNPHDQGRSPGGSSGGEGAIVGGGGSILGVGSDIAGSIRIPACFCGIYALKPTSGRLRYCTAGFGELIDVPWKEDGVLVQVLKFKGAVPFIRTNLPQGMRSFACANPIYGETCNPHDKGRSPGGSSGGEGAIVGGGGSILGVGSDIAGSIRIPACFCGIYALKPTSGSLIGNFGYGSVSGQKIATDGPMGRDLDSLVHFMEAVLSPELFALDPTTPPIPFRREMYENWKPLKIGYYVYDDCTHCVPAVERAVMLAKATLEKLGHTLVEIKPYKAFYAFTKILMPALVADDGDGYKDLLTLTDWFLKTNEAKKFRKEFTETWRDQGLDAVVCPCMPCVASTTGVDGQLLSAVTYTSLYNVVNFPAGTLPVTRVIKSDVTKTMDSSFYDAKTGVEKIIREDSEGTEGLPVGIQVVGLPYTEELVLRVMAELDGALRANRS
ncbi:hypothetical protein EGW08_002791 [Elysia chlorotica]|uniref:Amidase domain-containing protein n=1 Tax=Elysia chlorotica TaxID=188477 RepID=A0A433U6W1_ELYCH|nr:hypothetical protein EGW08_002791 [Elysia chlorotica]